MSAPVVAAAPALPGAENAGKPGYFTVRPGDTLIRIGLETGQNWRDIQAWNQLVNPNLIEVGQVLRVAPPGAFQSMLWPMARPSNSGRALREDTEVWPSLFRSSVVTRRSQEKNDGASCPVKASIS